MVRSSFDKDRRFRERAAEHARLKAVLESFAYVPRFGEMIGNSVPLYVESDGCAMGGLTALSLDWGTFRVFPVGKINLSGIIQVG